MIVENKQDFNESRVSSNPNAMIYHISILSLPEWKREYTDRSNSTQVEDCLLFCITNQVNGFSMSKTLERSV